MLNSDPSSNLIDRHYKTMELKKQEQKFLGRLRGLPTKTGFGQETSEQTRVLKHLIKEMGFRSRHL